MARWQDRDFFGDLLVSLRGERDKIERYIETIEQMHKERVRASPTARANRRPSKTKRFKAPRKSTRRTPKMGDAGILQKPEYQAILRQLSERPDQSIAGIAEAIKMPRVFVGNKLRYLLANTRDEVVLKDGLWSRA